jgi:hypothetical protein
MAAEIRRVVEHLRPKQSAGPARGDLVTGLVASLRHGTSDLRWRAALGLLALGPAAAAASRELIAALDDEDPLVRRVVANALAGVDWTAVPLPDATPPHRPTPAALHEA